MPAKATLTADQLLARYTAYLHHERYRAAKTIANYQNTLTHFWRFVGKPPEQVTPADLAAFVGRRPVPGGNARGKRLSPHTKSTIVLHVTRAYRVAYAKRWIRHNPLADVLAPRAHLGPARSLPLAKVAALLRHVATDPRLEVAVWLCYGAGLRVGEVARLCIEDVTLGSRPAVRVQHSKNGKSRSVPLAPIVAAVLERALAGRPQVGPLLDNRMRPGEHLRPKYLSRLVAEAMHQSGIAESAHSLRHTFTVELLAESDGTALYAISHLLGHGSVQVTERYAAGYRPDAAAAVRRLPDPRRGPDTDLSARLRLSSPLPAEVPELPGFTSPVGEVNGPLPPDDLLDRLAQVAPGLAGACATDARRLAELVPAVRDLLGRVNAHGHALDGALRVTFRGPVPDEALGLAGRLIGLDSLYDGLDQLTADLAAQH